VTNAKVLITATKAYAPNETLVQRYARLYSWDKEKLATVLFRFGALPEAAQEQLIKCLYLAFGHYQRAAKTTKHATASDRHKRLDEIQKTARKLLLLIEKTDENPFTIGWLEQGGIDFKGKDAGTVNAELAEAHVEVDDSITAVRKLHERSKAAASTAALQVDRKRGGTRHPPSAKGRLVRHAIEIYHHLKREHPDSGNQPGFGGPMQRFVHSVGALFGVEITGSAVEQVWRSRISNTK
jgi:hypothetical protein